MTISLTKIANDYKERAAKVDRRIMICAGTGCMASGAGEVQAAMQAALEAKGLHVVTRLDDDSLGDKKGDDVTIYLSKSGCQGFCQQGPLVTIYPEEHLYCKVTADDCEEIVQKTIIEGQLVDRLLYTVPRTGQKCHGKEEIPFYSKQKRLVLKECGSLDPEDIHEYINHGGYSGAFKAYTQMQPEEVCATVLESGLKGRGGAGFPTGRKWEFCRIEPGPVKYVICNGDEGDPGAFMDRSIMEGNPHAVLEGMMIAARGMGGTEGYIYVRLEYPLAIRRIRAAIAEAREMGFLGKNIFGTEYSFDVNIMEGAGAFVCGEETALIASIEGKRGMPTPKPPFPAQSGLWGKPTVINNVETLAAVPLILRNGPEFFKAIGTEDAKGTKIFALTGHVANTGLIEVAFGTTLGDIVNEIGGGITDDAGNLIDDTFKAVQIGGPSGACLTVQHTDLPLDYDNVKRVGAIVGSGGLVAMGPKTCMVSIARFFMQFTQRESCGKCVLCREGTKQMLAMLDQIIAGEGTAETLALLEETAIAVSKGSLCALGKTAPNPVLSTLRYFRDEYNAHVFDKYCPAGVCKAFTKPVISAKKCVGCGLCAKKCPVGAITGEKKQPHIIDYKVCINCGVCLTSCKFEAIS